jgi:hypothetical protein
MNGHLTDLSRRQFLAGPAEVCRLFFSGLWPKTAPPRAPAHDRLWLWALSEPPPHGLWPTLAPVGWKVLEAFFCPFGCLFFAIRRY